MTHCGPLQPDCWCDICFLNICKGWEEKGRVKADIRGRREENYPTTYSRTTIATEIIPSVLPRETESGAVLGAALPSRSHGGSRRDGAGAGRALLGRRGVVLVPRGAVGGRGGGGADGGRGGASGRAGSAGYARPGAGRARRGPAEPPG